MDAQAKTRLYIIRMLDKGLSIEIGEMILSQTLYGFELYCPVVLDMIFRSLDDNDYQFRIYTGRLDD